VNWTSIVRLCQANVRYLRARRHELSAAGALFTCFAIVLNVGPLTRSPISHSNQQISPGLLIPQGHQTELPDRLKIEKDVYDPVKPVIKLSQVSMAWASIYDASAVLPGFPVKLGSDDGKVQPPEPQSSDNVAAGRDTITGIWAPDDGACSDRTFRDGILPAVISAHGARAGKTHCVFKNQKQTEKDWRAVANCSNLDEHWTTHVRLKVTGNRLIWTSKRGIQVYTRCRPDVRIADAE
jgi:hypothetical protein